MLEARNRMSHTYDTRKALAIYQVLPGYFHALSDLFGGLSAQPE
jgi:hypothetical protein